MDNEQSSLTICLIDDDNIYQLITTRILELEHPDQKVLSFFNGKQAIDYFQDLTDATKPLPDVILLDLNMPVMNGWDFLEAYSALEGLPKKPPIFMVSSSVNEEDAERSKSFSVVRDFITKPVSKGQIKDILVRAADIK